MSVETLSNQNLERICRKNYAKIASYPKESEIIRYPKLAPGTSSTFNDIITQNMKVLIPNIELGKHNNYSEVEIETWIKNTKEYMYSINNMLQNKCNKQLTKLKAIQEQRRRSESFDMEKMERLPEDMIRCIYEFLMPETRMKLLLVRYPFYMNNLSRITAKNLKTYLACIEKNYVKQAIRYNDKYPDRYSCTVNKPQFYCSFTRKETALSQIQNVFETLRTALPKTPSLHRYFQRKALRLLRSLIYISMYKIDKVRRNKKAQQPTVTA
jgi:hypothetical protein